MSDFDRALKLVLKAEGGYVNDPDDPGGATNQGIIQVTYTEWRQMHGLPQRSVEEITPDEIRAIYRAQYWEKGQCDKMFWPLNYVHFDSMVQHNRAPYLLQKALGVAEDGVIGQKTLEAANIWVEEKALRLLLIRAFYYRDLAHRQPQLAKFLRGWLIRLEHVYEEVVENG